MKTKAPVVLLLGGVLLATSSGRADVIVVGKREIRGEIVAETSSAVRMRVGDGVVEIQRKQIKEIRREEEIATLLGEARSLIRTLDQKAISLFDRAIDVARKQGDTARVEAIQKERNVFATRLEKDDRVRRGGSSAVDLLPSGKASADDTFLLEADLDEVRVDVKAYHEGSTSSGKNAAQKLATFAGRHMNDGQARWAVGCFKLARDVDPGRAKEYYDAETIARCWACGQAVRTRDGRIAHLAIEPLAKADPKDAHIAYLDGRADEVTGNLPTARDAFKRALEGANVPNLADLPVDWLRELARRRACGQPVGPGSPGYGDQWRRAESTHFVVYHELGDDFTDQEPRAFEDARGASLLRLGMSDGDLPALGRLPMFIFKDKLAYQTGGGGPEWAAAHVGRVTLEDGEARTVYAFPGRRMDSSTMQHELAHVIIGEAFPDLRLPAWANEGVACFAEPDALRDARRLALARAIESGTFVPLADFLAHVTLDEAAGDHGAISVFYSEAAVVFATIVEKAGSVKEALQITARIARKGADEGLRAINIDTAMLEAEVRAAFSKK